MWCDLSSFFAGFDGGFSALFRHHFSMLLCLFGSTSRVKFVFVTCVWVAIILSPYTHTTPPWHLHNIYLHMYTHICTHIYTHTYTRIRHYFTTSWHHTCVCVCDVGLSSCYPWHRIPTTHIYALRPLPFPRDHPIDHILLFCSHPIYGTSLSIQSYKTLMDRSELSYIPHVSSMCP